LQQGYSNVIKIYGVAEIDTDRQTKWTTRKKFLVANGDRDKTDETDKVVGDRRKGDREEGEIDRIVCNWRR